MDRRNSLSRRSARLPLLLAALLAALGVVEPARADVVPTGMKYITATFEIANLGEHRHTLFVAFPFGGCFPDYPEHFKLNPQHDRVEHNYEVLRPGVRYQVQKFCSTMEIYALDRAAFPTSTRKLDRDLDWYRKKGEVLTLIDELDRLKTTDKIRFFAHDPRVRRSGLRIDFPIVVRDSSQATATHDVLRVAELTRKRLRIVGSKVIISVGQGKAVVRPYVGGKRPSTHVGKQDAAEAPAEPRSSTSSTPSQAQPPDRIAAAGTLTAPPERGSYGLPVALAAGGLLGVVLVLTGRPRRRQRKTAHGADRAGN